MWFPKFPYTNFSQINLDWILRQIRELSEWMNRYFKDIRQDLDKEINDRIEGDKALNARVDKEITDRTEADNALGKRIDKEIADRTEADNNLQANIDAEKTARENADKQLQANIDAEKTARENADKQLQANIDAEKTARENADRQLTQDITQLRTDAILKDGSTTTTAAIPFQEGIKTGSISEVTQGSGLAIESELDMNNHTIHSLADGVADTDAVNKSQLDMVSETIHSIPAGGDSGQVLAKVDGTDYNVTWVDQQGGGGSGNVPAGGTTGQVLAKATDADYQTEWVNQPEGLPAGGTEGQVLLRTKTGYSWSNIPGFTFIKEGTNIRYYSNNRGLWLATSKIPTIKIPLTKVGDSIFGQPFYKGVYSETIPDGVDVLGSGNRNLLSSYIYPYQDVNALVWENVKIEPDTEGQIIKITVSCLGQLTEVTIPAFRTLSLWNM